MAKFNNFIFAVIAVFASFISASAAVTDEKHCAPRACCGCPGNGRSQVKVLMNIFLDKLAANERTDAFQLVTATNATINVADSESCDLDDETIADFFNLYFPAGSWFRNVDFDYVMHHDGTIQAKFLAVVTQTDDVTKAYDMTYTWARDAQCNWHISKILAVDTACMNQLP